ncbi:hypothetical protein ANN_22712 [Periplaneta americana]|uniref:Uncharacterized protein n=1 Tax=Periplaneta americana TaxID=6978 RepID=A0ABQ8S8X4_PERAM|nr:hypothetical protein ANN_22712 [Periplaneta americana]
MREHNTDGDISLKKLQELVHEEIGNVSPCDWTLFCQEVKRTEDNYWEKHGIIEDVRDSFVINLGKGDSGEWERSKDSEGEDDAGSDNSDEYT